jgi:hypothetical protein
MQCIFIFFRAGLFINLDFYFAYKGRRNFSLGVEWTGGRGAIYSKGKHIIHYINEAGFENHAFPKDYK